MILRLHRWAKAYAIRRRFKKLFGQFDAPINSARGRHAKTAPALKAKQQAVHAALAGRR